MKLVHVFALTACCLAMASATPQVEADRRLEELDREATSGEGAQDRFGEDEYSAPVANPSKPSGWGRIKSHVQQRQIDKLQAKLSTQQNIVDSHGGNPPGGFFGVVQQARDAQKLKKLQTQLTYKQARHDRTTGNANAYATRSLPDATGTSNSSAVVSDKATTTPSLENSPKHGMTKSQRRRERRRRHRNRRRHHHHHPHPNHHAEPNPPKASESSATASNSTAQ